MTNIPHQEIRRRLTHAYKTLRRSIYWANKAARQEWQHDNCRYPLRNYCKHGTREDIKAAWCLRGLIRHNPHRGIVGAGTRASWDDATIDYGWFTPWILPLLGDNK